MCLSLCVYPQPPKKQPAKGGKTQTKGKDLGKKAKPSGSGGKAKKKVSSVLSRVSDESIVKPLGGWDGMCVIRSLPRLLTLASVEVVQGKSA